MKMKQTRHIELPANYKVQYRRRDYSTSITWQRYRYCSRSRYQLTFKSPHKKTRENFSVFDKYLLYFSSIGAHATRIVNCGMGWDTRVI